MEFGMAISTSLVNLPTLNVINENHAFDVVVLRANSEAVSTLSTRGASE